MISTSLTRSSYNLTMRDGVVGSSHASARTMSPGMMRRSRVSSLPSSSNTVGSSPMRTTRRQRPSRPRSGSATARSAATVGSPTTWICVGSLYSPDSGSTSFVSSSGRPPSTHSVHASSGPRVSIVRTCRFLILASHSLTVPSSGSGVSFKFLSVSYSRRRHSSSGTVWPSASVGATAACAISSSADMGSSRWIVTMCVFPSVHTRNRSSCCS
mmetsp:Transcript_19264/g.68048  ORF Transcript_19264/g.68048 Transcript_19264/m.68048 type:complete len:213 (+) Transcript_19264:396-1034(+)